MIISSKQYTSYIEMIYRANDETKEDDETNAYNNSHM